MIGDTKVHTFRGGAGRRRSLARMSRPLMRAIYFGRLLLTSHSAFRPMPCSGARAPRSLGTHPPQKSANFCRLFGVWRRGGRRRAGNIPASDPDTARRPSAVSRAMPSQTLAPRIRIPPTQNPRPHVPNLPGLNCNAPTFPHRSIDRIDHRSVVFFGYRNPSR